SSIFHMAENVANQLGSVVGPTNNPALNKKVFETIHAPIVEKANSLIQTAIEKQFQSNPDLYKRDERLGNWSTFEDFSADLRKHPKEVTQEMVLQNGPLFAAALVATWMTKSPKFAQGLFGAVEGGEAYKEALDAGVDKETAGRLSL